MRMEEDMVAAAGKGQPWKWFGGEEVDRKFGVYESACLRKGGSGRRSSEASGGRGVGGDR